MADQLDTAFEESLLDAVELEGDVLLQEEESGGAAAPEVRG